MSNSAVSALVVSDFEHGGWHVALPQPEIQVAVRIGSCAGRGLDLHALGSRPRVVRKLVAPGQRAVIARLRFGVTLRGLPASALAGELVELEDLWGAEASRLRDELLEAHDATEVAARLERAITARSSGRHVHANLAAAAADRLVSGHVNAVADELGVSARHLRRVFHEVTGLGPKAYAKLTRFRRALQAARSTAQPRWASIAAAAGYYDQAHLIAEFRAIAGVTPRALLDELRVRPRASAATRAPAGV